jgi:hypothetical protein
MARCPDIVIESTGDTFLDKEHLQTETWGMNAMSEITAPDSFNRCPSSCGREPLILIESLGVGITAAAGRRRRNSRRPGYLSANRGSRRG